MASLLSAAGAKRMVQRISVSILLERKPVFKVPLENYGWSSSAAKFLSFSIVTSSEKSKVALTI